MQKTSRQCRKCGDYIPYQVTENGITTRYTNRKFCVKCSPYGKNNRRRDDPAKPPQRPGKYKSWTEEEKQRHRDNVNAYGFRRKQELVRIKGGKCEICGYNKCLQAMSFHHRDPSKKEFSLDKNGIAHRPWNKVIKEAKKCDLLCVRCHIETESLPSSLCAH